MSSWEEKAATKNALRAARLLALDVDGVLTDGRIQYVGEQEMQAFHVHDGQALVWLRETGMHIAWITGRGSAATEVRARELGVRELHCKCGPKDVVLAQIQEQLDIPPAETIAMGDDLPDLALASRAALFVSPANARPEVRSRAALVTSARGGEGAVRELAEAILRAKGLWEGRLGRYGAASE